MIRLKTLLAAASMAVASLTASAQAATFDNTDAATITMSGGIELGDEQKFLSALRYAPNFRKLVVNSPGGAILTAYLIAKGLRAGSYEVQVAMDGRCVSSCTLMMAAASERSAYSSSRIAVHSASTFENGERAPETDDDLATTARMARYMKDWGTPAVILGKMIGTPGETTTTLTDSDLREWNVRIIDAGYTPPPTYTPPVAPTPAPVPAPEPRYTPPAEARTPGQRILRLGARFRGHADGAVLAFRRLRLAQQGE